MHWQQAASLAIVGATAAILVWRTTRRRKFSLARNTHCGCGPGNSAGAQGSIVYHARKGERCCVRVKLK